MNTSGMIRAYMAKKCRRIYWKIKGPYSVGKYILDEF